MLDDEPEEDEAEPASPEIYEEVQTMPPQTQTQGDPSPMPASATPHPDAAAAAADTSPPQPSESSSSSSDTQAQQQPATASPRGSDEIPKAPRPGMLYCLALKPVINNGMVLVPGAKFWLDKADALRARDKGTVKISRIHTPEELTVEPPPVDPQTELVACRALRTCLVEGMARATGDVFMIPRRDAVRASLKGQLEFVDPS